MIRADTLCVGNSTYIDNEYVLSAFVAGGETLG